jgi:hypothetical protein
MGANGYGNSIIADELKVSLALLLENGFTAQGSIRIAGADIGGQFRLSSAEINGSDKAGYSVVADGARISGAAYLDDGFRAAGAIGLPGAEVSGLLSLAGARLGATGLDRLTFAGDGLKVGRDLVLRNADCAGGIRLAGAVITGALAGQDTRLGADAAQQNSLVAAGLEAGGDRVLDGATATGAVIMAGARVDGMLSLAGATVSANSYGNALNCSGTRTGRDIALNTRDQRASTARGTIRMAGAEITGSLHCEGAHLTAGIGGNALTADGIKVGGTIYLTSQSSKLRQRHRPPAASPESSTPGLTDLASTRYWPRRPSSPASSGCRIWSARSGYAAWRRCSPGSRTRYATAPGSPNGQNGRRAGREPLSARRHPGPASAAPRAAGSHAHRCTQHQRA